MTNQEPVKDAIDSQKAQIINELMTGVVLTPLDAIKLCGCTKLSTRIGELCKEGFPIERKMIEVKVRKNKKTRVMSYWIDPSK